MRLERKYLLVFAAVELIAIGFTFAEMSGPGDVTSLKRPEYGDGDNSRSLQVAEGELWEDIEVDVSSRIPDDAEAEALINKAKAVIDEEMMGENPERDQIRTDLVIRNSYLDGAVSALWDFSPFGYISSDGRVDNTEITEPVEVRAIVELSAGGLVHKYEYRLQLVGIDPDSPEAFRRELDEKLTEADEAGGDELVLPEEVGGVKVRFREKSDDVGSTLSIIGLIMLILMIFAKGADEKKRKTSLEREYIIDYPDIVSKLSLYVGAGFSVRAAFERIVSAYEQDISAGRKKRREGFEQICVMVREMSDGKGELDCYEAMAERVGVSNYRKLSMMLCANLRKGSRELVEQLESEEAAVFEDRKMRARIAGEEASTKLLMPMMGLLLIIMVVLVMPAVSELSL